MSSGTDTIEEISEVDTTEPCICCTKRFDEDEMIDTVDGLVCENCRDAYYYTCERCSDLSQDTSTVRITNDGAEETWCQGCVESNATWCECDNYYSDDLTEDGLCRDCRESEDSENMDIYYKRYSGDLIADTAIGKTILSLRTFGAEIECDMYNRAKAGPVSRELPKTCGIATDGSVRGSVPVEVITPPLQGKAGEDYINEVCTTLKKSGTVVNRSCGLHVHLGAEDYKDNFERLRELFIFYMFSEDVIYSFLPKSRWNNRYCKKLVDMYFPTEVEKVRSISRFEEVYYKEQDPSSRERRKGEKYDGARYTGVNFHALFHNGHTIEIRSHSGTVSADKILHWVALHQAILDHVASGLNVDSDERKVLFSREHTQKERTEAFFRIIHLPKDTLDYFMERQAKFLEEFGKNDDMTSNLAYAARPTETPEYMPEDEPVFEKHEDLELFRYYRRRARFNTPNSEIMKQIDEHRAKEKNLSDRFELDNDQVYQMILRNSWNMDENSERWVVSIGDTVE